MTYQIHALSPDLFADLFALDDTALAARNMRRMTVDAKPGTPCRVSLADAKVGETVLLLNFEHQPGNTPYRSSHAIFVREGAVRALPAVGEVPEVLQSRLISVRLFDRADMMIDADAVDGGQLGNTLTAVFENAAVAYAHLHYAKPGCFAASVTRAA